MNLSNIFLVFAVRPSDDSADVHRKLLGKFLLSDGNFEIIEDHGLPAALETASPGEGAAIVHRLANSMHTEVVSMQDIVEGKRPDLIETPESVASMAAANAQPDHAEFEYQRVGAPAPQIIHVSNGNVFLDGHGLSPEESQRVMQHVQSGQALLRRKLAKNEDGMDVDPRVAKQLNEDSLTGLGSRKAYRTFIAGQPQGVHIMVNMNDFGQLSHAPNNYHVGNKAMQAVGNKFKEALEESVGKGQSAGHRVGGDLLHAHVPTSEHAASFLRSFRAKLESIPSIGGSHQLTASAGYGLTPESAAVALAQAKYLKNATPHIPGRSGFVARAHPELG